MNIEKFYDKCIRIFSESLEQFELYHFSPYYETKSQEMMLSILANLKESGKKAELIVDFDEYSSFDCMNDVYFEDGLLHITGNKESDGFKETLILKPEEMLIRCKKYNMSGNFVFIRNAALKNYEEKDAEKETRIILEESDMNVLIHAKGSKFTDSNASHSLMQFLKNKSDKE